MRYGDVSDVQRLADEWGWELNAVAFALGYCDGNVADAKAMLARLADDDQGGA